MRGEMSPFEWSWWIGFYNWEHKEREREQRRQANAAKRRSRRR